MSARARTKVPATRLVPREATPADAGPKPPMSSADYDRQLSKLQRELVKLQEWVVHEGLRVCVLFEGRDAAGKGGTIKRIVDRTNPRVVRVVALPKPDERERSQWYFQRYVAELPSEGEIVLFDRSWYNRAGVERVMGFCTDEEYEEFFRATPALEAMIIRSGIVLVKYWFSVSDDEQERRFQERIRNPRKRWKLSEMDLQSRARWVDYSRAKDRMFELTDTKLSPWWVVHADDKRRARLNCISHLLSQVPYRDLTSAPLKLPQRQTDDYVRPPETELSAVPERY
jgi:polyphosphate kinase 2